LNFTLLLTQSFLLTDVFYIWYEETLGGTVTLGGVWSQVTVTFGGVKGQVSGA
jgi:hypothetical protein